MKQLRITQQITNRESESLDKYFVEIGKMNLISADEEAELARRIRQGDLIALERLTKANLRFVVSVAKQFQNRGLPLNDLINEGNLGLIRAAQRFDETRGFKFISYAVWWIRQAIMQALAEQPRIVRLPLSRVGMLGKIGRTFSELEQAFQREPSAEEIANAMATPVEAVYESLQGSSKHISVDSPMRDGEEGTLLDVISDSSAERPDRALMVESLKSELDHALSLLSKREAEVLQCFFGLGGREALTLEEIGVRLNLTRERVRQIKTQAMSVLRKRDTSSTLVSYL